MTNLDPTNPQDQNDQPIMSLAFDEEILISEAGFSFQPIQGFELEVDGSVYMYSDDGNLEIIMIGGKINPDIPIIELSRNLAWEFMENFDELNIIDIGNASIQGVSSYLSEIHFYNAGEEGTGQSLICSPYGDQFFFLLVISALERWEQFGQKVFTQIQNYVHFQPKILPKTADAIFSQYSDLTVEVFQSLSPEEDFIITTKKGDLSILLAARTLETQDQIWVTDIFAPGGENCYHYDPTSQKFNSTIVSRPLFSTYGEVCIYLPLISTQPFIPGDYRFTFCTRTGSPIKEIQAIIRRGDLKTRHYMDLNLWLALDDERFNDKIFIKQFEDNLRTALTESMQPLNLIPNVIVSYYPAPDELEPFSFINLEQDLADCSYIISGSVENQRAINIGLVDLFSEKGQPSSPSTIAVTAGSPGMILSSISPHACILVNYSAVTDNFSSLADEIVKQLIAFLGFETQTDQQIPSQPLQIPSDLLQRIRVHPIFYCAG